MAPGVSVKWMEMNVSSVSFILTSESRSSLDNNRGDDAYEFVGQATQLLLTPHEQLGAIWGFPLPRSCRTYDGAVKEACRPGGVLIALSGFLGRVYRSLPTSTEQS